jgi:hypothetical protein
MKLSFFFEFQFLNCGKEMCSSDLSLVVEYEHRCKKGDLSKTKLEGPTYDT